MANTEDVHIGLHLLLPDPMTRLSILWLRSLVFSGSRATFSEMVPSCWDWDRKTRADPRNRHGRQMNRDEL